MEVLAFAQHCVTVIKNPVAATESSDYLQIALQSHGKDQKNLMKIGELANKAHTQIETIRYYEREGLIPEPARSESNYRVYGDTHAERLSFIRHCRGLDMTLDEIRVLLKFKDAPTENCGDVNALLDEHIEHVAERIKELGLLEKQLKGLRLACQGSQEAEHCGILNELTEIANGPLVPNQRMGHLHGAHSRRHVT